MSRSLRLLGVHVASAVMLFTGVLVAHPLGAASPPVAFAAPRSYAVASSSVITVPEAFLPYSIATADLNGDGKADLVTANFNLSVSVLLGSGDGSFLPHLDYPSGGAAFTVAIADVNGDRTPDLVVGNVDQHAVSILIGRGDGTFRTHVEADTGSIAPTVVVGDFNNDGKVDIATTSYSNGVVSVVLGNGDGTFQPPVASAVSVSPSAWGAFAASDFDGDGRLDFAIADRGGTVTILRGNGDGTFRPVTTARGFGGYPQSLVASDLDSDGKTDLIIGNASSPRVQVLFGCGDGTFGTVHSYSLPDNTLAAPSLAALDANGDGKLDVAIASGNDIVVLTNNGDGTFSVSTYPASAGAQGITALDANGDGSPDLAGFGGAVNVLLNTSPPIAAPLARLAPPPGNGTPLSSPVPPVPRVVSAPAGGTVSAPLQRPNPLPPHR